MYFVYCDGGSRGNPGNAAVGVVIKNQEEKVFELGEYIGIQTNNVAEYQALISALKKLKAMNADNIKIHLDSELVVKQINGIYKVKNLELQKLFIKAIDLTKHFENIEIVHVKRELNKEADAMVNKALDEFEQNKISKKDSKTAKLPMSIMLENKVKTLEKIIENYEDVVIGYSGGIDSTVLSYVSSKILGKKALAVTIVGAQSIGSEIEFAREFVKSKNINHLEIPVSIFENEALMENTKNRCYHCKQANFGLLKEYAKKNGYKAVVDGGNVDDLSEERPGLKAIKELEIKSPFIEAQMTKKDIIELAQHLELGLENKKSNTCLITRIPVNSPITETRLRRVDKCEEFLKTISFMVFRVRDFEENAVIELQGDINITKEVSKEISSFFKKQGYKKIYIDMDGYQIGSMAEKE